MKRVFRGEMLLLSALGGLLGAGVALPACHGDRLTTVNGVPSLGLLGQPTFTLIDGGVTIDFGPVLVSQQLRLQLDVGSLEAPLVIDDIVNSSVDPSFTFPLLKGEVLPLNPKTVLLTYAPSAVGNDTATYLVTTASAAVKVLTVTLTGRGVDSQLVISPRPADFGPVEVNRRKHLALTILNSSDTQVGFVPLPLFGIDAGAATDFLIDPPAVTTVGPHGQVIATAHYAPQLAAAAVESVMYGIALQAGGAAVASTTLLGTPVTSLLQIPSPLFFGFVTPGQSETLAAVVENLSDRSLTLGQLAFSGGDATPPIYQAAQGATLVSTGTLPAHGSATFPVSFNPPAIGQFDQAVGLVIPWTDLDGSPRTSTVEFLGYGGGAVLSCGKGPVDFGPVVVGQTDRSQSVICTNVGTSVPGYPQAGLLLRRSQLSLDQQNFGVELVGEVDGGLLLAAGQSAMLALSYAPLAVETDRSQLTIVSDDVVTGPLTIELVGEGIEPGPCSVGVSPPSPLTFAQAIPGTVVEQPLVITNLSSNFCEVTNVALSPGSNADFSLTNPIPYQLLSPVDATPAANPGHQPSQLVVPVQFAPQAAEQVTGAVNFMVAGAAQSEGLSGNASLDCLSYEPSPLDFGSVGISVSGAGFCASPLRSLTVLNRCAETVHVTGITIDPAADASAQFHLQVHPPWPALVPPGDSLVVAVSFDPQTAGAHLENLLVATDRNPAATAITLLGTAATAPERSQEFRIGIKQVDLLWLVDDDDDVVQVDRVSSLVPGLISLALQDGIDFQMGVISTDTCATGQADRGWLEPCDHCADSSSSNAQVARPVDGSAGAQQLAQRMKLISTGDGLFPPTDPHGFNDYCYFFESLKQEEQIFQAVSLALDPLLLSGHNAGFLRPQASLAVVAINGDSEDDMSSGQVDDYLAEWVAAKNGRSDRVSFSYIDQDDQSQSRTDRMVSQSGGLSIRYSLADWQSQFANLLGSVAATNHFVLDTAALASSVVVSLDGQILPSTRYHYDPTSQSVVFDSGSPKPGDDVIIQYAPGCP